MDKDYYKLITNIANFYDGLVILDDKGKIIYHKTFNSKGFKVNENNSIGKTPMEVFNDTEESSDLYRAYKYGKSYQNRIKKVKFRDGQELLVENNTYPIINKGKILGAITLTNYIDGKTNRGIVDLSVVTMSNPDNLYQINDIIGNSPKMKLLKHKIYRVSRTKSNVLIYGETGTGKELVAQSIHSSNAASKGYFISQNCAAIPDTLLESIFFGTTKGSFTGALDRPGIFEIANGGTIFLDEINSMSLNMQAKLLRAIEEKKIIRVGGSKPKKIDVRFITALNKPPKECINENILRKDLFYRLSSIQLMIPPLRERKSDIPLLTEHFIKYFNQKMKIDIEGVSDPVYDIFNNYDWPGNIRELQNVIEYAFNFATTHTISIHDLPETLFDNDFMLSTNFDTINKINLPDTIETIERDIIISKSKYSKSLADLAERLGISKQSLNYKLNKYNLKINIK